MIDGRVLWNWVGSRWSVYSLQDVSRYRVQDVFGLQVGLRGCGFQGHGLWPQVGA